MKMKILHPKNILVSEELNNFFKNATQSLQIYKNPYIIAEQSDTTDFILKAIK